MCKVMIVFLKKICVSERKCVTLHPVGISIPDDKAEKIGTVGDAIAYIEENAK